MNWIAVVEPLILIVLKLELNISARALKLYDLKIGTFNGGKFALFFSLTVK